MQLKSATYRIVLFLVSLVTEVSGTGNPDDHIRVRTCEPIGVEMCQGLGYNVTGLPNFLGHETQQEADLQLRTFTPLIQYGCSGQLKFFLCTAYAPMCTEKVVEVIGPCRSVCDMVRDRCEPVLHQFGFPWPAGLNCSKFHPSNDNHHMCMEGPAGGRKIPVEEVVASTRKPSLPPARMVMFNPFTGYSRTGTVSAGNCQHLLHPERFVFSNHTQSCLLLCNQDLWFSQKDKNLMDVWMTIWSTAGLLSTAFVVVTFLVDHPRFSPVERHVVFMSSCSGMCSVAYLVRVIVGRHAISCVPAEPPRDHPTVLAKNGLASTDCTVLFVILYYFTMAGIVWWLVVTLAWLFVAGLHWTVKATQRLATYFHIIAWTVPAVQIIVVLVRRNVEPNELTGMCHVTSGDSEAVMGFVVAPMVAYLFIGVIFLAGGLLGYYQSKARRGQDLPRPEVTGQHVDLPATTRVATFALICALPLLGMIVCVLVRYVNMERSRGVEGRVSGGGDPSVASGDFWEDERVNRKLVSAFLIEVLMSVLVAVFTAFRTVLNPEARQSWKDYFRRKCGAAPGGSFPPGHHLPPNSTSFSSSSVRSCRRNPSRGGERLKQLEGLMPLEGCCRNCPSTVSCQNNRTWCRACAKHHSLTRPFHQYVV